MKYRIIKKTDGNGKKTYYAQERKFMLWFDIGDPDCGFLIPKVFKMEYDAKKYIEELKKRVTTKTVIKYEAKQ